MHWLSFDNPGLIPKHPHVPARLAVKLDDRLQHRVLLQRREMIQLLTVAVWT